MKISKIFHWLYLTLLVLPIMAIPIFAVYSHRHTIEGNQAQVQENLQVDFNQKAYYFPRFDSGVTYTTTDTSIVLNGTLESIPPYSQTRLTRDYPFKRDGTKYYIKFDSSTNLNVGVSGYSAYASSFIFSVDGGGSWTGFLYVRTPEITTFTDSYFTLQIFDLTQMFGRGNEPTMSVFDTYFTDYYYQPVISSFVWIENYSSQTFTESDIISQFSYCVYNATENYLNLDNFFVLGDIHIWLVNNFFGGVPSLYFTIAWHFLTYWFVVSIFWLLFDVLMYLPMLVHRWLDKGAIA